MSACFVLKSFEMSFHKECPISGGLLFLSGVELPDMGLTGTPRMWYNRRAIEQAYIGGRLSSRKGGDAMSVYETIVLMIAFATLVVLIMNSQKK